MSSSEPDSGSDFFSEESLEEQTGLEGVTSETALRGSGSPGKPDVTERLYKETDSKKRKMKQLVEKFANEEKKLYTFSPRINSSGGKRSVSEFIEQMNSYEAKKREKLQVMREKLAKQAETAEFPFRPSVCEKSAEIYSKKDKESVFDKLYKTKKTEREEPTPSFTPSINPKSQSIARDKPINDHLYQDAIERRKHKEVPPQTATKLVNTSSEQLLVSKFTKEFQAALPDTALELSGFYKLLHSMHFIASEEESQLVNELWTLLGENPDNQVVLECLLAIMGFETQKRTLKHKKLRAKFFALSQNRSSFFSVNKAQKPHQGCSFKPSINQESLKIAEKNKSSEYKTHQDFLYSQYQKLSEKKDKIKANYLEKERQACTFRPSVYSTPTPKRSSSTSNKETPTYEYNKLLDLYKTNPRTEALYNLHKKEKEFKESLAKSAQENLEAKIKAECTFSPQIDKKVPKYPKTKDPRGVKEAVERMRKAREDHLPTQAMKERSTTLNSPQVKEDPPKELLEDSELILQELIAAHNLKHS